MATNLRWADEPDERSLDARGAARETRALLERASKLYASSSCPGSAECCHLAVSTRPPWLWPTEFVLVEAALRAQGRAVPPPRADGACRLLDEQGQRCTIYEARPFGCRTFFCERRVGPREPTAQTHALLDALAKLNVALESSAAPRTLDDWLSSSATSPAAP